MTYISDFGDVGPDDVAVAGGKGVGLGGLVQAGLPVPPGFVLNTAAYADFVAANHLGAGIQELAALPPLAAPQDYEDASKRIRALFTGGTLPAVIAAELDGAYRLLGNGDAAVAVRSSATAEDLASASFAGQQDTYLNVRGPEALAAAVIDCWASLWTARAMAYRAREGIGPDAVRLAVVVQQMVEADAAGVMFTANPANGRRDQTVISAAWGLGESVVSGTVTTDDVVVEADTGRVLSRRTADKEVMTVYADRGTREQPVPAARRRQPVLDDKAAAELAGHGTRIADHFGAPQDIEWARAGDQFFILQSRPITALPEPSADTPDTWPVPYPNGLYFRASIVEQLPDPLSPLFADLIDGSVSRSLRALMAEAVGKNVVREDDVGLPTDQRLRLLLLPQLRNVAGDGQVADRDARAGPRQGAHGSGRLAGILASPLRGGDQGLVGEARRGALRSGTAGGCAGAAGRRHRVLHGRAVHHSDRRNQRNLLPDVLRQVRAARRRPACPDVPPRLRQRTHPGREVAVRPRGLGPGRPGAGPGDPQCTHGGAG